MKTNSALVPLLVAGVLCLSGCSYEFPLTERSTRPINQRLLGDWVAPDPDGGKDESLHVRRYDDTTYVIAMDNDLYRAFHTDFADTAFVSVQSLQSDSTARQYSYFRWQLSDDGTRLTLRSISTKIVPEDTKDRAAAQALIKANLTNPRLYNEPQTFTRKKAR